MVNCSACAIELGMHLRGLLGTQEAIVARGHYATFVVSSLPGACIHDSMVHAEPTPV